MPKERARDDYLINFSGKVVHLNPPWEDCNTDALDSGEKAVRSLAQLPEYRAQDYTLCKKCHPKQAWPRG